MKLVSVIMPSCNSENWVTDAVLSVLAQSYQNLELIVIDDGSTDTTISILDQLKKRDRRLKVIARSSCSGGPATPRNQGVEISQGHYLAFIDSDDLWHTDKLKMQVQVMEQHGLNFLSSMHKPFAGKPPKAETPISMHPKVIPQNHASLIRKNWVITSSSVITKSLFADTKFNQEARYVGVEDYLTWLHLHQKASINSAVLASPLVFYRMRSNSLSSSKAVMASKIFTLLSHYQYKGKPLGNKKFYYFATYIISAVRARIFKASYN